MWRRAVTNLITTTRNQGNQRVWRSIRHNSTNSSSSSNKKGPTWTTTGGALVVVLGGAVTARYLYSHLLHPTSPSNKGVPMRDSSTAKVLIRTHPATSSSSPSTSSASTTQPTLTQQNVSSDSPWQQVNAEEFEAFLQQQRQTLQQQFLDDESQLQPILHQQLQDAFQDSHARVSLFADWYFAYPTTYKLLGMAMSSGLRHAVTFGKQEQSLQERISQDLQDYIAQKYQAIVLRPAMTDPKIHRAMVQALKLAHDKYQTALDNLDQSVQEFVQSQPQTEYYTNPPASSDVIVTLDWPTQLQKVQHLSMQYESFPERTAVVVASGAAVGSKVGTATILSAVKTTSTAWMTKWVAPEQAPR